MSNHRLEEVTVTTSDWVLKKLKEEGYVIVKSDKFKNTHTFRVTDHNQFYSKFINLANRYREDE